MDLQFIEILRPHHWSKNAIILLGFFLAFISSGNITLNSIFNLLILFFSFCIISSGNYVLNDLVDREFDKNHPLKKKRVITQKNLSGVKGFLLVFLFWFIGFFVSSLFLKPILILFEVLFLLFAILYNTKPFRFKAIPILDVLTESFNSPIRLYVGWFVLVNKGMNFWILVFVYFYTAVLMNSKRLAELQHITPEVAKNYREVFRFYTKNVLSVLFLVYFIITAVSLVFISLKYEILFLVPSFLWTIQLYWYYKLAIKGSLAVQKPVYIYRDRLFFFYSLCVLSMSILTVMRIII